MPASHQSTIEWECGEDRIVVLTLDDSDQSANTMNAAYRKSMATTIDRLESERAEIIGVIITSGKKTFFAGGDLHELLKVTRENAAGFAAALHELKKQLRRLEKLGRPVVAAINGAALGGGLEIALATHHRIIVDDPRAVVGFPEVQLGLLPGAGGVVRSVRMLGISGALTECLLQGQRLKPERAHDLGLVDDIVAGREDLIPAAKAWITANPGAQQPWDADQRYRIPGGTPSSQAFATNLPALPANLRKQLKGANYPAPHHIMAAAVEGAQVDIDTAFEIETRYFGQLAASQVAKNMIQAFFFDMNRLNGARVRPDGVGSFAPKKVAILGAGMMGAGIAYQCAHSGVEVVLKDISPEAAHHGKSYSEKLVTKAVEQRRMTQQHADDLLARITATDNVGDTAGSDLVIEAVYEAPDVKQSAWKEIEPIVAPDALLASNTSTLPIADLAEYVTRPEDFIGIHFFSPVDKMPLVEIIRGKRTSTETVCRALDLAKLLKKTPILVNDSRGFFTSRVFATFIYEGIAMLAEGIPAPSIEQASSQAGYPAPVLQLSDELNLSLMRNIRDAARAAALAAGRAWTEHPAEQVIDQMLDVHDREGRAADAGFYDYAAGRRAGLWDGLPEAFPRVPDPSKVSLLDLAERMLFIESIEAIKCLDEGVIESVADANIGTILGIGFPGWTGGVLQYINGYEHPIHGKGPAAFVSRARALASDYGGRFEPPASLIDTADAGRLYKDSESAVKLDVLEV